MTQIEFNHETVMLDQAVQMLNVKPSMTAIDCTAGGGGHTQYILNTIEGKGKVLAFDQDPVAISQLSARFSREIESGILHLIQKNFCDIDHACKEMGLQGVDAILADIGVSSPQLDHAERGFSFREDGPLDMRMNQSSHDETAADVVNTYDESELSRIIFSYGEDPKARFIARAIVNYRKEKPITRTLQLASIIKDAVFYNEKSRKHPATKAFQALRIHVNRELEVLKTLIEKGFALLNPGGRLAIITFHSLEDRIVKNTFKELSQPTHPMHELRGIPLHDRDVKASQKAHIIKPFPQIPTHEEIARNPRARSAKLRVIEKINTTI